MATVYEDVQFRYLEDKQSLNQTLLDLDRVTEASERANRVQPGRGGGGTSSKEAGSLGKVTEAAGRADMALARVAGTFGGVGSEATRAASDMFALSEVAGQTAKALPGVGSGLSSLLVAGGVGIALVAVGVAMGKLSGKAKEAREEEERYFRALEKGIEARQKTSTEIEKQITEIERQIAAQRELQDAAKSEVERLEGQRESGKRIRDAISGTFQDVLGDVGVWQGDLEAAREELKKTGKSTEDLEAELEQLTSALNSAEVAANDAAERLLKDAAAAGDAVRIREQASKAGYEANAQRLEQINAEKAAIQAELDLLRAQGGTSEEVQNRIKELTGELDKLGQEAGIVGQYANGAARQMAELEKKYGTTAKEIPSKLAEVNKSIADAGAKYSDAVANIAGQLGQSIRDIKRDTSEAFADLAKGLSEDFVDMEQETAEARLDAMTEFVRDEAAALRDMNQRLKGIRRDGLREEQDAAEERNFLAIARIREQTKEELADEKDAAAFEKREREIQFGQSAQDRAKEYERSRRDRLIDFERSRQETKQNMDRQIHDARIAASRQQAQAAAAYQAEIRMARQKQQELLKIQQQFWAAMIKMAQQGSRRGQQTMSPDMLDVMEAMGM